MYVPTLSSPDEAKLAFYEDLTHTIEKIPKGDFFILMWDFNAWVGRVHVAWPRVIEKYGLCKIQIMVSGLEGSVHLLNLLLRTPISNTKTHMYMATS